MSCVSYTIRRKTKGKGKPTSSPEKKAAKQHGNPLSLLSMVLDGGLKPRNRSESSGEGWSSGMLQPTSSGAGGPDEAGDGWTPFFDNLKPRISVMDSVHGRSGEAEIIIR
ncbi:unnamed protein product [Lactuca virosa]|uniref:Uncharacterized protein n=1 Tax=Lactuca virosa TaxID=75947 RepID=A0AAU9P342_9ASTR|nr:unnamed protein product [Lactuca virosa]